LNKPFKTSHGSAVWKDERFAFIEHQFMRFGHASDDHVGKDYVAKENV
jgi:hypothetical protein